jgi:phage terminase large subunit-like protein
MADAAKRQQLEELEKLLEERGERERYSRLEFLEPYPWQQKLMASSKENQQTLLMAANRVGKSYIGAANLSYHLTGLYPEWWEGHRWKEPINAWASGVSSESTRDILQNELLGTPENIEDLGTGAIPRSCIGERTRKPQIPNGIQSVLVKHHTDGVFDGWSKLTFKAFEQGESKFMGTSMHEIWLDEQPPDGLFTQCITRTANTGGHVTMTFTPEDGMTKVVNQFMNDRKPGMALLQATWEDAPHLTDGIKKQLLAVYNEHERDMRSKGIPLFGSGPVFMIPEEELVVEPFEIPNYWPMIAGMDFGYDHPTAVVWFRWDRDSDTVYLTDVYRSRKETAAVHAAAINARPRCNVAWPHDGMIHDKGSGVSLADQYRSHGVQMLPSHFTNPLAIGDPGKGNYKVEPGINAIHEAMQQGRFKVFKTCTEWFEEFRMYHREDGKIVALDDDLMSATRYAYQSLRYAEQPSLHGGGYNKDFHADIKYTKLTLV